MLENDGVPSAFFLDIRIYVLYKRQAREAAIASNCSLFFQSFKRQTITRIYASLVCPERYFLR